MGLTARAMAGAAAAVAAGADAALALLLQARQQVRQQVRQLPSRGWPAVSAAAAVAAQPTGCAASPQGLRQRRSEVRTPDARWLLPPRPLPPPAALAATCRRWLWQPQRQPLQRQSSIASADHCWGRRPQPGLLPPLHMAKERKVDSAQAQQSSHEPQQWSRHSVQPVAQDAHQCTQHSLPIRCSASKPTLLQQRQLAVGCELRDGEPPCHACG